MKRRWIGSFVFAMIAIILVSCGEQGATGQVESLSPDEMKETIANNDDVYVLVTDSSEEEERQEYIDLVEENIENDTVYEINAQNSEILENEMQLSEIGLEGAQLFQSLSYYKNGELQKRISLRTQKYESLDDRKKAISQFINESS
jgi:hypothetical protein